MASKPLQTFPSRQWSCSTLLRGSSFLSEQRAAHKDMNCDDLLSAARARLQKLKAQSIAFSPAASFAAGSFETPSPKQPTTVQRCPSDGPDRRVPCKSPELPNSKDKTQFRAATADLASACEEALQPDEVEPRTKKAMDEETKKMYAMSASLRRLCCPKPSSGKLEVSPEVYKQWKLGGDQRKALLKVLINADGNRDRLGFVQCGMHVCDILPKHSQR